MKKTFAARRVPRKIGQDDDGQDDDESPTAAATKVGPQAGEPFLSTAHSRFILTLVGIPC